MTAIIIITSYLLSVLIARKFNILSNRIDRKNIMITFIWFIPFGFVAYGLYYFSEKYC